MSKKAPSASLKGLGADAAAIWPSASYDRLRRRILFAAVAFGLVLVVIQAFQSWHSYRATREQADARAANLVYVLSAHLQETVAALDASLVQLAVANTRLGGPNGDSGDWRAVLTGAVAGMPTGPSLSITDSDGIIRQSTIPKLIGQSRRDLYLFQTLRTQRDAGLVADKPFRSQTRRGTMLIPLGRRLEGPDGSFQGVVVVTMRLEQLRDFYRSIDVGKGGSIRILHTEGKVLFNEPSLHNPIDMPAFNDPVYLSYRRGLQDGRLEERVDGRVLITAFHALPSPGMLVAVSLDRDAALAAWRRDLAVNGGLLAAELIALIAATLTIMRLLKARQAAALRLLRRERQLLLAESIAEMGAVTFDVAAGTARPSPNIAAIFGWAESVEETSLQHFLDAVDAQDRARLDEAIMRCQQTGEAYRQEFRIAHPDGAERIILSEGFHDSGSQFNPAGVIAICQDVTSRRLAERQLIQSQKMEGLGQLTGGVAHDFNNLLTVISLNLEELSEWPGMDSDAREMAQAALKAADRSADLIRGLLAFARRQPLRPRVIDLNEIVQDTHHLLQRTLGDQVELETHFGREIGPVAVDPAQLQAALVNLAVNARDAMAEGGKLTIETSNVSLDEHYAAQNPGVQPGPYVLLAVSDTGSGIPAEIVDRVFEPFFTTKEIGKGTGLGLSMTYGFVKQSHGHIKIYSEIDQGTTVKLYLPRSAAVAGSMESVARVEPKPPSGEAILVVEDDVMVREFIVRQLERLGYRTFAAGNGPEALSVIDRGDPIDLMLTDVMMPGGMTGKQLAVEAEHRRPGLKVAYMSGYTENAILHHGRLDPDITLLSKPFRAADLERVVREMIAGDAP